LINTSWKWAISSLYLLGKDLEKKKFHMIVSGLEMWQIWNMTEILPVLALDKHQKIALRLI